MSEKVLVYDKAFGVYYEATMEDILEVQNEVNSKLGLSEYISLQEYIDILNQGLPEDKKIKLGGGWFQKCGFQRKVDDDIFKCIINYSMNEEGEKLATIGVAPVEKEEDLK